MKENKFELEEEEEESVSMLDSSTRQHKRSIRHHVRKRSNGNKLHVAKLPMTRTESNSESTSELKVTMKRSQSQRTFYKPSSDRRRRSRAVAEDIDKIMQPIKTLDPISTITIAPPIAYPLNAVANDLVIPNFNIPNKKKPLLFSQFISSNLKPKKTRKELDIVNCEYRCIKNYQDPMLTSLMRCATQSSNTPTSSPLTEQRYHHLQIVARASKDTLNRNSKSTFWKSPLTYFYNLKNIN